MRLISVTKIPKWLNVSEKDMARSPRPRSGRQRYDGKSIAPLFRLDAGVPDDLGVFRHLAANKGRELTRRAADGVGALLDERALHVRGFRSLDDLARELVEHRRRQPGGRHHAVPRQRFVAF